MTNLQLPEPIEFEWDEGNENKIFARHGIGRTEAEQPFFNPHLLRPDEKHSTREKRYSLLGITDTGKVLFLTFTVRKDQIRIISARSADKRERTVYGQKIEKNS